MAVATIAGSVLFAQSATAAPIRHTATVSVGGAVGVPITYTGASLARLPQTTLQVTIAGLSGHTVTGVLVESVVQAAAPIVDTTLKNGLLRVRVTVTAADGRAVTTALGELDPSFGNHPALLVLAVDGHAVPDIAFGFPGDTSLARTLLGVRSLTVAVASTPVPIPPVTGGVVVRGPKRIVTLSAATLARLPSRTTTVTFAAGTGPQTHTETGPPLWEVLLAAGIAPTSAVAVAAVGSDGYVATATPGEAFWGGRNLLLSLTEDGTALAAPRLVTGGDVKGGRYVSGVVELDVTR